ncbi:hypothetical protein [Methylovirgula sp. 4M-Z18]|uniref:hypothetical protein n=1 Tax=Methylovirgula sp. 4M-Z18 TaxID=2293567 RepID=UPI000E2F3AE0|nr:hypothetical protein [Methylovirgula sp. 4M-Z18]RFB76677.1 hypothetical protein DYH55_19670 [Methylovirgula sp. 4M-Z18]
MNVETPRELLEGIHSALQLVHKDLERVAARCVAITDLFLALRAAEEANKGLTLSRPARVAPLELFPRLADIPSLPAHPTQLDYEQFADAFVNALFDSPSEVLQ